jgi:Fic family protein
MKIPINPPNFDALVDKLDPHKIRSTLKAHHSATKHGDYLHWDKLRHLQPPEGLTAEEWWLSIKIARKSAYQTLPFKDKYGKNFQIALTSELMQKLSEIDRKLMNFIQHPNSILNSSMRDSYLMQSFTEEAITSSQLEGASTTYQVAKEMLRSHRRPHDYSEQMIYNNYHAMEFMRDMKNEVLTKNIILELQKILTINTLENPDKAGTIREPGDDINVVDNRDNTFLHTPSDAAELENRIKLFCDFANNKHHESLFFIHPLTKAILLHFMLAYDHPFIDGNGRTARTLFYWCMRKQNYKLIEYISISEVIKCAPAKYAKAFLYTETDERDVTYFVIHQLDVILEAVKKLEKYHQNKTEEAHQTESLIYQNETLRKILNYRQIALISHVLKHSNTKYKIENHRSAHNVRYDTARNDLLGMEKLGLLTKSMVGKTYVFVAVTNLKKAIKGLV